MQVLREHLVSEKVLEKHDNISAIPPSTMSLLFSQLKNKVFDGFQSIKGSPPELYKCFGMKFLDSLGYFTLSLTMTIFLTEDFGYNDVSAGTIYGLWGSLISLFGLLTGFLVDNLGVAASLRLGFSLQLVSKVIIFFTTSRTTLLFSLALMSLGGCLGIPVLTIGVRRYSTSKNRGFNFGLFYVIMNFAAFLSGPLVDYFTIIYKGESQEDKRYLEDVYANDGQKEWSLTGYRLIVLLGICTNIIACLISLTVKEIKVQDTSSHFSSDENQNAEVQEFQPEKASCVQINKEVLKSKTFWKFLCVIMVTLNVRMIFRHLDATLPKYMVREFGESVPKGTIYSINPLLIMVLVPIVTAMTTEVDPLVMIHHGCYISAASVFFLAFSTTIPACILFVVFLSIGEAIWSPRLYDYTCSIAKEGREGTFMALASAPLFLAKLPVGIISGYLLSKYCPEEGPRDSKMMWLIIGLITASSPIMLTLFWGYISKKEENTVKTEYNGLLPENELTQILPVEEENVLKRRTSNNEII